MLTYKSTVVTLLSVCVLCDGREHRIEANGGLYIPRVREEDAGTYECRASNLRGEARLPIVLVIGGEASSTHLSSGQTQECQMC